MAVIGGRNVGNNDLVIMGSGVLMIIVSFLPWYGASFAGFGSTVERMEHRLRRLVLDLAGDRRRGCHGSEGLRWPVHAGCLGNGAVGWGFITAAVSALAFIIMLLRWVTFPSGSHGVQRGRTFRHLHRARDRDRPDGLRLPEHRSGRREDALAEARGLGAGASHSLS